MAKDDIVSQGVLTLNLPLITSGPSPGFTIGSFAPLVSVAQAQSTAARSIDTWYPPNFRLGATVSGDYSNLLQSNPKLGTRRQLTGFTFDVTSFILVSAGTISVTTTTLFMRLKLNGTVVWGGVLPIPLIGSYGTMNDSNNFLGGGVQVYANTYSGTYTISTDFQNPLEFNPGDRLEVECESVLVYGVVATIVNLVYIGYVSTAIDNRREFQMSNFNQTVDRGAYHVRYQDVET